MDDSTSVAAAITGKTQRYVRMVRKSDRKNEEVLLALVEYKKEKALIIEKITQLQELYREAAKTGRTDEAMDLSAQLEELDRDYINARKAMLAKFHED